VHQSGQLDAWFIDIRPVNKRNIADSLNENSGSLSTEFRNQSITRFPVRAPDANFDEFMMRDARVKFFHDRRGQTRTAHGNHRFELMTESTKVLFLRFRQSHGAKV